LEKEEERRGEKKRDPSLSYLPRLRGYGEPEMASGDKTDPVLMHLGYSLSDDGAESHAGGLKPLLMMNDLS